MIHASLSPMTQWMLPHFCYYHHSNLLLPSSSSTNVAANAYSCSSEPCFYCCRLLLQLFFISNIIYCHALRPMASYRCCCRLQTLVCRLLCCCALANVAPAADITLVRRLHGRSFRAALKHVAGGLHRHLYLPWLFMTARCCGGVRISVAGSCCTCFWALSYAICCCRPYSLLQKPITHDHLFSTLKLVCVHTHIDGSQTNTQTHTQHASCNTSCPHSSDLS